DFREKGSGGDGLPPKVLDPRSQQAAGDRAAHHELLSARGVARQRGLDEFATPVRLERGAGPSGLEGPARLLHGPIALDPMPRARSVRGGADETKDRLAGGESVALAGEDLGHHGVLGRFQTDLRDRLEDNRGAHGPMRPWGEQDREEDGGGGEQGTARSGRHDEIPLVEIEEAGGAREEPHPLAEEPIESQDEQDNRDI